ncbi:MAG TPA: aldehyde ferredoxin oxidoreductase C-terminal domain-containing protein [Candidatus Dormibacteraeota bacterium]|nr:aldehyde ferredoxin oxidoreductase C-terminal domain-containing protein [Candidatus Dormibacteraeota bacterium]
MPRDLLEIDLAARTWRRGPLPDAMLRVAPGGAALAVRLLDDEVSGALDPLGPENPLVFAAGPFAGSPVPAATKHALATISPLTGLVNDTLSSSHWSAALRRLGLAALVVRGRADAPTVLVIGERGVEFPDASGLLGRSAAETARALRERLGDRRTRVSAIGPAGERLARFAAVENDGRQAGRGGAGAVFGAKGLKAIALRGGEAVPVADPERVAELAGRLRERALGPETAKYRTLGTAANMRVLNRMGLLPTRNFTAAAFEGTERVTPERARESPEAFVEYRAGCANCPVQCEHRYVRRGGDPRRAAASEYESAWAFGPNCGIDDLDAVLDAIERCDRYGLDTISTGGAIAWTMECVERGLLTPERVGADARFGNAAAMLTLVDAIAAGEGFGALLGQGVRAAATEVGGGSDAFAMHCKGLEMPGYEPRGLPTYALGLAVCTRGACHNRAATYDLDLRRPDATLSIEERAQACIDQEDYASAWDTLLLCKFVRDCFDDFWNEGAELLAAGIGGAWDAARLRATARETWARKRAINARLGWTPQDDVLPERLYAEPLRGGPAAGLRVDRETLARLKEAYERRRAAPWSAARELEESPGAR